jgi:hypothetical protein
MAEREPAGGDALLAHEAVGIQLGGRTMMPTSESWCSGNA